jgi:hypothetical protein
MPGAALTGGFHWVLQVRGTVALPAGPPQPPSPAARKPGRGWKVPSQRLSRRSQDTNGDRYDEAPDCHPAARDRLPVDTVEKHIGHLLGKLGAANRTEPSPGRQPGLVP